MHDKEKVRRRKTKKKKKRKKDNKSEIFVFVFLNFYMGLQNSRSILQLSLTVLLHFAMAFTELFPYVP